MIICLIPLTFCFIEVEIVEVESTASTTTTEVIKWSILWRYFTEYKDKSGKGRAILQCKYCKVNYQKSGTGNLKNHMLARQKFRLK